jgi:DNA processing protein
LDEGGGIDGESGSAHVRVTRVRGAQPPPSYDMTPVQLQPGNRNDELVALVALVRGQILKPEQLAAATEYYGSAVEVVRRALDGHSFANALEFSLGLIREEHIDRAVREVREWSAEGLDVRSMLDERYPANLLGIHNKPAWLFFAGQWDELRDSRAVAVVGTRKASEEGIRRAQRLSRELGEAGYTVFSGMARGIDTAAHISALKAGGRTVAVMGTGIQLRYPPENERLADAIVESGAALVSSFLPRQPPTKWSFPVRNVVMSGMCLATVVVEAGATSGAKMQAQVALHHGRSVFLPKSLVDAHAWARKYVTEGVHGVRAVEVASTDEIVHHLELDPGLATPLAV